VQCLSSLSVSLYTHVADFSVQRGLAPPPSRPSRLRCSWQQRTFPLFPTHLALSLLLCVYFSIPLSLALFFLLPASCLRASRPCLLPA
jgi:hypothetical protein